MMSLSVKIKSLFLALVFISIWFSTLAIIYIRSDQTRIGYSIHQTMMMQEILKERNLRLRCELATMYDLEKAKKFAASHHFLPIDPAKIRIVESGGDR